MKLLPLLIIITCVLFIDTQVVKDEVQVKDVVMDNNKVEEENNKKFIETLDSEIAFQFRWEKLNRDESGLVNFLTWLLPMFSLVLSTSIASRSSRKPWVFKKSFRRISINLNLYRFVSGIVVIITVVSLSLPFLNSLIKFDKKQEVYDTRAKQYQIIKLKLITHQISLNEATSQFEKIHTVSPEKLIRQLP